MTLDIPNVPALALGVMDYCTARDRVLELARKGIEFLDEAERVSNEHVPYGFPGDVHGRVGYDELRRRLDGRYWQFVFDRTGAAAVMDGEARKQFRDQLDRGDVPEFTPDNVTTHFLSMSQDAEKMFDRGVYNLFHRVLSIGRRGYRTNQKDPFAVPRKMVLTSWFSSRWTTGFHVNYYRTDEVNDFGRIVNVLAGRPYSPRGFEVELNAALEKIDLFENAIVKVRAFRNGNAHVWIKDRLLLDKVNARVAAYCSDQLPVATDSEYGVAQ